MPPALEVTQIAKTFGDYKAVNSLSFTVPQGAMYGLLGPNGAGKTTTIRMLMDIIVPDSGSVNFFGEPFKREHLRRVGYLPEERGLYKKMKIKEMLIFLGLIRGLERPDSVRATETWMKRLEMDGWEAKKVDELSKGMQQKVQFAATLLHNPDLIILDEPFTGLDPVNASMLQEVMLDLERQGKTIIFSTHRMEQVERMCAAICLVNRGQAVLQGNLREIKRGLGSNTIVVRAEGDHSFLASLPGVKEVVNSGNFLQVKMQPGTDAQAILQAMIGRLSISHFELTEPSLEEIFIMAVGKVAA